jgi:hypothetical protein
MVKEEKVVVAEGETRKALKFRGCGIVENLVHRIQGGKSVVSLVSDQS